MESLVAVEYRTLAHHPGSDWSGTLLQASCRILLSGVAAEESPRKLLQNHNLVKLVKCKAR